MATDDEGGGRRDPEYEERLRREVDRIRRRGDWFYDTGFTTTWIRVGFTVLLVLVAVLFVLTLVTP
jgi:hypothetical protein